MTQMTQKQIEAVKRMNTALQANDHPAEVLDAINDFMYAMPASGPLDAKMAQELFHDTPVLQDVDAQDENGDTLLHHFVRNGDDQNAEHKEFLAQVLSYNPNPFVKNNKELTASDSLPEQNSFLSVLSKYTNNCIGKIEKQLRELISYAVIEPDMNKELAEFKTSRQGFMAIANQLAGKKDVR